MEPGLEAVDYYDPPNMTYPFGAYICVLDIDVETGVTESPPLLRARRLRHPHQPDGDRGPGAWRADRGVRHRDGAGASPMTRSAMCRAQPDGLLPADRGRDAGLGDRPHRDALAAPSDRRQGRRREPECRRRAGLLQRRERCLRASRRSRTCQMPHDRLAGVEGGAEASGLGTARCRWIRASRSRHAARPTTATSPRPDLAMALALADGSARRPLLLEGEAGVGKTETAKALAAVHGARLIRLQCYEGLDASAAIYEWNYQRQLLAIKARETTGRGRRGDRAHDLFRGVSAASGRCWAIRRISHRCC